LKITGEPVAICYITESSWNSRALKIYHTIMT